jgi:ABC-type uncharacterized transport system permease subunit
MHLKSILLKLWICFHFAENIVIALNKLVVGTLILNEISKYQLEIYSNFVEFVFPFAIPCFHS